MTDISGIGLFNHIARYCERVDCTIQSFALVSGIPQSTIDGWRRKEPRGDVTVARVFDFIAKHPTGFPGAQRARQVCDHAEGGATLVLLARSRSIAPARPCPRAVAAAAAEDAWARAQRQRRSG